MEPWSAAYAVFEARHVFRLEGLNFGASLGVAAASAASRAALFGPRLRALRTLRAPRDTGRDAESCAEQCAKQAAEQGAEQGPAGLQ